MEKPDKKQIEKIMEQEIEKLTNSNKVLTETINNLNFLVETLKESNKILNSEINEIEQELDVKSRNLSEFLVKHGLSFEDIIEYETEKKIRDDKE
jgi:uncharacterized protein Yka (UPF0111/DUF47 family)